MSLDGILRPIPRRLPRGAWLHALALLAASFAAIVAMSKTLTGRVTGVDGNGERALLPEVPPEATLLAFLGVLLLASWSLAAAMWFGPATAARLRDAGRSPWLSLLLVPAVTGALSAGSSKWSQDWLHLAGLLCLGALAALCLAPAAPAKEGKP